jgi:hypothetical protein
MTIEQQLKESTDTLASKIEELINQYQKDTEVFVSAITIEQYYSVSGRPMRCTVKVTIDV